MQMTSDSYASTRILFRFAFLARTPGFGDL